MKLIYEVLITVYLTLPICSYADHIMAGLSDCSTVGIFYSSNDTEAVCMGQENTQQLYNIVSSIACMQTCMRTTCSRAAFFESEGKIKYKFIMMIVCMSIDE